MVLVNKYKKLEVYSGPSFLVYTKFINPDGSIRELREQCLCYTAEQAQFMVGVLDIYSDLCVSLTHIVMEDLNNEIKS